MLVEVIPTNEDESVDISGVVAETSLCEFPTLPEVQVEGADPSVLSILPYRCAWKKAYECLWLSASWFKSATWHIIYRTMYWFLYATMILIDPIASAGMCAVYCLMVTLEGAVFVAHGSWQ